jgi:hypothetical protein
MIAGRGHQIHTTASGAVSAPGTDVHDTPTHRSLHLQRTVRLPLPTCGSTLCLEGLDLVVRFSESVCGHISFLRILQQCGEMRGEQIAFINLLYFARYSLITKSFISCVFQVDLFTTAKLNDPFSCIRCPFSQIHQIPQNIRNMATLLSMPSWQNIITNTYIFTFTRAIIRLALTGCVGVLVPAILYVVITYIRMLRQRASLPPGPFPWPIVGNTLQLSSSKPWLQFKAWSRANGNDLLTIWIGRTPTIICNDAWSASELFEKNSSNYSSRSRYVVFGDLTGQSTTNQVLLPYGNHWRLQRKIMVRSSRSRH